MKPTSTTTKPVVGPSSPKKQALLSEDPKPILKKKEDIPPPDKSKGSKSPSPSPVSKPQSAQKKAIIIEPHEMAYSPNGLKETSSNEELFASEENILNSHVDCVKIDAQLLTEEGDLITSLQQAMGNDEEYDIQKYLHQIEMIAERKIEMYVNLVSNVKGFRKKFVS